MRFDHSSRHRLGLSGNAPAGRGFFGTVLAAIGGIVVIALGLTFSLAILAVAVVVGTLGFGFLWWKSRALRRQLAEQMAQMQNQGFGADPRSPPTGRPTGGGDIIEGEVIREERER